MGRLKPTLILGGPGCGKTTALLKIVEAAFSRGVAPDRIAFVAFTRRAAQEAKERMVEKFGLSIDDIPYFKTLHSFAFTQLDVEPGQILDGAKLAAYAKAEGLELSAEYVDEFGQIETTPTTDDERALTALSLARLTRRDLEDVIIEANLDYEYVSKLADDYELFKKQSLLVDFTDLIVQFVDEATVPQFDLLIVDEAQDLSKLQWAMVDKLADESKDVYFAGDDDQAIYSWAGADIEHFLNLDADREVLPTSYRLKRTVFDACQNVINCVDDRYPKDWQPHADGGEVDFVGFLDQLDMSEGTWFLLARTNFLVKKYTKHLRAEGLPYIMATRQGLKSSVEVEPVQAALVYENLKSGKTFNGQQLRVVWDNIDTKIRPTTGPVFEDAESYGIDDLCSTGFDPTPSWLDALSISGGMQEYIRAIRARGESLTKQPRITASTIHGVKGGEADNVVINQKLSARTYSSWVDCAPNEYRVLFTAMSRAKERLIFLHSTNKANYGVERILQ